MCVPHHRAIEIRINGPRVDRRFSTTAGGESDPGGISELLRLLDVSADGWSRPTGADNNSLLLRRRTDNEPDSDLYQTEINSVKGYLFFVEKGPKKKRKRRTLGKVRAVSPSVLNQDINRLSVRMSHKINDECHNNLFDLCTTCG